MKAVTLALAISALASITHASNNIIPPYPGAFPAYVDGKLTFANIQIDPGRNKLWSAPAYSAQDTFKLHSRPGAKQVIFLDFDGHIETLGGQHANNGNNQNKVKGPIISTALDLDNNPASFNTQEHIVVQQLWLSIAGVYAAYDIDITTEDPGEDSLGRFSVNDQTYGSRIVFGKIPSFIAASGGTDFENVLTRRSNGVKAVPTPTYSGRIVKPSLGTKGLPLHEVGHTLSMWHPPQTPDVIDGHKIITSATGKDSEVSWRSVMGGGTVPPLAHFLLPDLAGLYKRSVKQRADDHGDKFASASSLHSLKNGAELSGFGVIESNVDLDLFHFQLDKNENVNIHVQPAIWAYSLDALTILFDKDGKEIARSNPLNHLDNWLNLTLESGKYFIAVRGTGRKPTPGYHNGYLDFGSTGAYTLAVKKQDNDFNAPQLNDDFYIVQETSSGGNDGMYTLNVLANDTASSGNLNIVSFTRPSADIPINPGHTNTEYFNLENNQFKYKLRYSAFLGEDQFTYTAVDSSGKARTATVTIHVQGQDKIHTIADLLKTSIDEAATLNLLSNDVVASGTASITAITQPKHGAVTYTSQGEATYTPEDNYTGYDSFTYTAEANGESQQGTVTVQVFPASEMLIKDDSRTTSEDIPVPLHVLANDASLNRALRVVGVSDPLKGSVHIAVDHSIVYTPDLNTSGQDQFTYEVTDRVSLTTATATVNVRAYNDNPVGVADKVKAHVNKPIQFTVLDNDFDVDSGISLRYFGLPQYGKLSLNNNTRTFTYTPEAGFCGSDKFSYTTTDNNLGRGAGDVTITVTGTVDECTRSETDEPAPTPEQPAPTPQQPAPSPSQPAPSPDPEQPPSGSKKPVVPAPVQPTEGNTPKPTPSGNDTTPNTTPSPAPSSGSDSNSGGGGSMSWNILALLGMLIISRRTRRKNTGQ
ncbi:hypothetical protein EOPP23_16115 [Endozoicomonas sp. OPT23]|uniref:Ig-like domain-containing protein n=1 Tax=Endozoicomonas sp. OPT23 TaxID=2072845 RepID=UPI00129ACE4F|nr:Ig-like domain-containing protein [Endozoicomonas sp. OPT23]MRI34512.1 hypothetical protein [Endozoicomonas sp. OPT23]